MVNKKSPSTAKKSGSAIKPSTSSPQTDSRQSDGNKVRIADTKVSALNVEDVCALSDETYAYFMRALDEACKQWIGKAGFCLSDEFIEKMETTIGVIQIGLFMYRSRMDSVPPPTPKYSKDDWRRLAQPFSVKPAVRVEQNYRPSSPLVPPAKRSATSWSDIVEAHDPKAAFQLVESKKRAVTPPAVRSRRRIRVDPKATGLVYETQVKARNLASVCDDLKDLASATCSSTKARNLVTMCYQGFAPLVYLDKVSFDTIGDNKYIAIDYEIHSWKRVLPPFIVTNDQDMYKSWGGDKIIAPEGYDVSWVNHHTTYEDLVSRGDGNSSM